MKKLFNPLTRFQTNGVKVYLPQIVINFIWERVDDLASNKEVDYLQVFQFRIKKNILIIEHRQEAPKYKKIYKLSKADQIHNLNGKIVYVIDDYDYCVMMLSDEY